MLRVPEKYSIIKHKDVFGFLNPVRTGKKYFRTLFWLIRDGLRQSKLHSLGVVVANFIGVSSGVLAFSLIVGFIKYRIEGRVISFKGFNPPEPPAGLEGLILYGGLALGAGLVSAGLIFFSKWGTFHICKRYQKNCVLRCIEQLANNDFPEKDKLPFISPKHGWHQISTIYCRYVAFSYRFFLEVSLPLITFLFALIVLLYLDPLVTLSLVPFASAYIVPLYKLNRKSAKAQGSYLTSIGEFNPWLREITRKLASCGNPYIRQNIPKLLHKSRELTDVTETLYRRLSLKFGADFLSRALLVICMVWLFLVFGNQVIQNQRSWVSILTFIVALRFTGTSLQQVVARFVNISRFYPAVAVYQKFVSSKPKNKKAEGAYSQNLKMDKLDVVSRGPKIEGSYVKGKLQRGSPFLIFFPFTPTKKNIKGVIETSIVYCGFGEKIAIPKTVYNSIEIPIESMTIFENMMGACNDRKIITEVERSLDSIGILSETKKLPLGLKTPCTKEVIDTLSEEAKFGICNLFGVFVDAELVVLNANRFLHFSGDFQKKFLSIMNQKFIVLASSEYANIGEFILAKTYEKSFFAVAGDEDIAGFGDFLWFTGRKQNIENFLNKRVAERNMEDQYRDDLFDDDSDMDDDI